jgi:hypothetical protein
MIRRNEEFERIADIMIRFGGDSNESSNANQGFNTRRAPGTCDNNRK